MDVAEVVGLVFRDSGSGIAYGVIRPASGALRAGSSDRVIAEDESGNAFLARSGGTIAFWDHETGQVAELAESWEAFVEGCTPPQSVQLNPNQVRSAWIDPGLAKELGLEDGPDGWQKRPDK